MPRTLDEILADLAEYLTDGDPKLKSQEVARALHKNDATQPVAQVLITRGTGKKMADASGKITDLEARITDLTETLSERDQELENLKSAAPDWKKKLDQQEQRAAERQKKLQDELDEERKGRRNDTLEVHRQRAFQKLQPGVQVDADYADVLMSRYGGSFRLNEERKLEVTEPGGETVYDVADGDPVDAWVRDVLGAVPPKFRLAGEARPGSGSSGESTGGLRPKTLEQVREQQRKSGLYAF